MRRPVVVIAVLASLVPVLAVAQSFGVGKDYSANGATVPPAGLSLLATIPASQARGSIDIQNQSAATVNVVRDDGAGGVATTILLGAGTAAGTQGGAWTSRTFKGRVRVYGAAGAQVSISED